MPGLDIATTGTGFKNLAIGAAITVGVIAVVYYGGKIANALSEAKKKAEEGTGYLLGTRADVSLGSTIFEMTNDPIDYYDEPQALKTCRTMQAAGRSVNFEPCKSLLSQYGGF